MLLHKGGCIGITEAVWLREDPPEEIFEFWQSAYPEMRQQSEVLALIPTLGYELLGHFVLPESSWWESYYNPMLARIEHLRSQYAEDTEALAQLDEEQREIDLYRRYHDWYGYAFFVMRKSEPKQ